MKITISGTLGSGKSTVGKMLAEKLGYKYYTTGGFMRDMAEKRGITLKELSAVAEKDPLVDKEIDDYQINLGKKEDNFILEGRLGYYFIPSSTKIFIKCSDEIAAERVLKEFNEGSVARKKEGLVANKETILSDLRKRRESERKRYKELYNINHDDESNFDFVV
ncbi:MAG: (d)CMP kinase, partial [Candidatus Nanoarchaeia archaeon]